MTDEKKEPTKAAQPAKSAPPPEVQEAVQDAANKDAAAPPPQLSPEQLEKVRRVNFANEIAKIGNLIGSMEPACNVLKIWRDGKMITKDEYTNAMENFANAVRDLNVFINQKNLPPTNPPGAEKASEEKQEIVDAQGNKLKVV